MCTKKNSHFQVNFSFLANFVESEAEPESTHPEHENKPKEDDKNNIESEDTDQKALQNKEEKPIEKHVEMTPEEKRKDFLMHNLCLQLHISGLEISKQLHQFFDPEKKGYTTMSKIIFAFLNYYKIVMLP